MSRVVELLPRARPGGELIVQEIEDETIVYDTAHHQAHCLNRSAAVVFRLCDGSTSMAQASAALIAQGLPAERAVIELAVDELRRAKLLVEAPASKPRRPLQSRRDMLRQAALIAGATIALPLVQSIVAPSIAEAGATCGADGQKCCPGIPQCDNANSFCNGASGLCEPNN